MLHRLDSSRVTTAARVDGVSEGSDDEGLWTQIIASTAHDADMLNVSLYSGGDSYGLIDIGVGASSAEVVILSDILVDYPRTENHTYNVIAFTPIPAGSRIAARMRSSAGDRAYGVRVSLIQAGQPDDDPLRYTDTYGTDTTAGAGASGGTNETGGSIVDPGAAANTMGAWKELTASTDRPTHVAQLIVGYLGNATLGATTRWRIQIGTGAASSEQVIVDALTMVGNSSSDTPFPAFFGPFPLTLPAGARIAVRASCSGTDATDRLFQCAIYCSG